MMTAAHVCPGCGKPGIPHGVFACKRCWYRLPKRLRDDINHGWRYDLALHQDATDEAMCWYAEHPPAGVR